VRNLIVLGLVVGSIWFLSTVLKGRLHKQRLEAARLIGDVELLREAIYEGQIRQAKLDRLRLNLLIDTPDLEGGHEHQYPKDENAHYRTWGSGLVKATWFKDTEFVGLDVESEFRGSLCGVHFGDPVDVAIARANDKCEDFCIVHEDFPHFGHGPSENCYGWMLAIGSIEAGHDFGRVRSLVLWNKKYQYVTIEK
jgi:hypothetical protein